MMTTQHALRPYATAGIALVGASMIAITPLVTPPHPVQARQVRLVDAWSTLLTDTTANLDSIVSNANASDISAVLGALVSNPLGVLEALTNLDPTVTTDTSSLPVTIEVQLPPGLELLLAQLGEEGATLGAVNDVVGQLSSDPSNALNILYEGTASILNAALNGADNVSVLDGIINIPVFNGLLAPLQTMDVNLNLTDLINALGLGDLSLSHLDLTSLLSQIGLGDLTLGSLFDDLKIGTDGLGTLLGDPTLTTLLGDLGLGDLGLGSFSLTSILSDLGLYSSTDLNSLTLADVLGAFGIDSPLSDLSGLSLSSILSSFGVDLPSGATLGGTTLTSLLTDLGLGTESLTTLLQSAATDLGGTTGGLIDDLLALPGVETITNQLDLGQLVSGVTLGDGGSLSLDTLLGDLGVNLPSSTDLANTDIADVLTSLGIKLPGDLTIANVLGDLGFGSGIDNLTLGQLLDDFGAGSLDLTNLLNNVSLDDLLGDLGLSNLPLNLSDLNLTDLSNLNLDGLLGDLGLGDIANITVGDFGGLAALLADEIPQQILASI
jgi:hypothetical protein